LTFQIIRRRTSTPIRPRGLRRFSRIFTLPIGQTGPNLVAAWRIVGLSVFFFSLYYFIFLTIAYYD